MAKLSQVRRSPQSSPVESGLIDGTLEQQAIWAELLDGQRHVIVQSVAGSGKTTTGIQYCLRDRDSQIAYVAFNKHIQVELSSKIQQPNVECMTYHSLGYRAIRNAFSHRVKVNQYKTDGILEELIVIADWAREAYITARVRRLVSLAKQYGVIERADLETLVDHHWLAIDGIEEEVYDLVTKVLIECKADTRTIEYDDMVWLPKELGLRMPQFEVMLIDEAQDTNLSQQWLALHAADRLVVIGDKFQSIYGFRGSDVESMSRIEAELAKTSRGVVSLPLSFTRRCPKSHVKLAQRIVPHIQSLESAADGIIRKLGVSDAIAEMQPGDLVLCRVNAELVWVAYKLIRRGIKAVVRGKSIGDGILKLIEQAEKRCTKNPDVPDMLRAALDITLKLKEKYEAIKGGKGRHRAGAVMERFECLSNLCEEAETVSEIKDRVVRIFGDFEEDGWPKNAVVLGTVHRTKGLESHRVYVLRPDLIPHPMARQKWERQQELNLGYVACTRSTNELVWVGGESPLFV